MESIASQGYNVTFTSVSSFLSNNTNLNPMYYCTFRNLWTMSRHPNDYPLGNGWAFSYLYSHTIDFQPWHIGDTTTLGVEEFIEYIDNRTLINEFKVAGEAVLDLSSSRKIIYNLDFSPVTEDNFAHIDPVNVAGGFPYLSSIISMKPSPDWFTGFNSFNTIDNATGKYFDRFTIQTWPLDAGTADGETYYAEQGDTIPYEPVKVFTVNNTKNGIFLDETGTKILPVGEWDCYIDVAGETGNRPKCDFLKDPTCTAETASPTSTNTQPPTLINGYTWPPTEISNQSYTWPPTEEIENQFASLATPVLNLCMNIRGSNVDGNPIVRLWTCNGDDSQMWTYDYTMRIRTKLDPSKCLTVYPFNPAVTALRLYDCEEWLREFQTWTYDVGRIRWSSNPDRCIAWSKKGAPVRTETCVDENIQLFWGLG